MRAAAMSVSGPSGGGGYYGGGYGVIAIGGFWPGVWPA